MEKNNLRDTGDEIEGQCDSSPPCMDAVIVVAGDSLHNLAYVVSGLRVNVVGTRNVYVVTKSECVRETVHGAEIIDENALGIDKELIESWFRSHGYSTRRVNWYFQQFLKLAFAASSRAERLLVWDGDTIAVSPVRLASVHDGKVEVHLPRCPHYHRPYFETNVRLLGIGKVAPYSFITEFAVIDTSLCRKMIDEISDESSSPWYLKVLGCIGPSDIESSGFSEYELIGSYQASNGVSFRFGDYRSLRRASSYFGLEADHRVLDFLGKHYQFVSFEKWGVATARRRHLFRRFPNLMIAIELFLSPLRAFKEKIQSIVN